jgi:hypothetical protein
MIGPLHRLLGVADSYPGIKAWQEDLIATADQPVEVTRPRRAVHLVILSAFLLLPLVTMLPAGIIAGLPASEAIYRIRRLEAGLPVVRADACADGAAAVAAPPLVRLLAVRQTGQDGAQAAQLAEALTSRQRQYDAGTATLGTLTRWCVQKWADQAERQTGPRATADPRTTMRQQAIWAREAPSQLHLSRAMWVWIGYLAFWPAAWIIWAALSRGGFSYSLAGIRLVQSQGRPASRWQCAWRTGLVWMPVAGVLICSVALECSAAAVWSGGHPSPWLGWFGWMLWWVGMSLPPLYGVLALWWPTRSPLDRLAGTYLVPK